MISAYQELRETRMQHRNKNDDVDWRTAAFINAIHRIAPILYAAGNFPLKTVLGRVEMAYSNFTLAAVLSTFQLEKVEAVGLFSEAEAVAPSADLTTEFKKKVPLATTIGTEKGSL